MATVYCFRLISKKVIHLVDSEIVEITRAELFENNDSEVSSLPLAMIAWNDLIIYANELITILNSSRHALFVNQVRIYLLIAITVFNF